MAEELFALSTIAPAPAEPSDYDSICAALMQTERGRWFLEEYAKRNRSADNQILLTAIQRIETVVCADRSERDKHAQHGFRTDLLEMAKAITRTRAEVAEIPSDSGLRPEAAGPDGEAEPPPRSRDVFAAAERIRDVTWAMRGHGFDPSTCDQLEELAAAILSASALRDPTDRRASKLSEVLQYLEHRIDTLLVGSPDGEAEALPEPQSRAALSAPAAAAEPIIGLDDPECDAEPPPGPAAEIAPPEPSPPALELAVAAEPGEPVAALAADVPIADAEASQPPSAADVDGSTAADRDEAASPTAELVTQSEPSADEDVEPVAALAEQAPAAPDLSLVPVIDLPATDAELEPPAAEALENPAEDSISPQIQEVEAQTAELTSAFEPSVAAEADGSTAAVPDEAASPAAELATQSVDPPATDAEPAPPAAAALENPAEDTIAPQIQEVEAQTAELTSASELDMAAGTEPATAFADQAPVDALTAPDLSATDAELELESPDAEGNQAEDSISPQIQEVEAQTAELTSASEPDPADSTEPTSLSADQAPAAPSAEAAPDELSQAGPARTAPEAAPESAAPSAPAMEPDGLAADPETRLRIVDLTYVAPWLPGSGLQPAAAALQAVDAFLPGMHMRAAMPGIATAPAGEVLRATAVTLEIMAAAPAPARSAIVIDLDEAGWAALGPPEPDRPPPSRAAPQPEAAEDIPAWQSELPSPADAAELRAAPAASPPEPAATAPAQAAPAQAAVAPVPRPPASDPLAALKVMSAEELIALFS